MALPGQKGQATPGRKTRSVEMKDRETVECMLKLHALGWGTKRISREVGCARNTVRHYIKQGRWMPAKAPVRAGALDGLKPWVRARFVEHQGNADVVRQELISEHGLEVSLRTVERAVEPYRRELQARARATVRYETSPGEQLQIDFGSRRVVIDGVSTKVFLFVATLGYSRRCFVRAFLHERQSAWMQGIEEGFRHFGGRTEKLLIDNPKPMVIRHTESELIFNERFKAFCRHWDVSPRACKPYRAQTKGKVESGVKYVKRNALAGRAFASWEALEAHLLWWMREISDPRDHGTTGEPPIERFERDERPALRPLEGRSPFLQLRELQRKVHHDSCVLIDTNAYSVPWKYIRSDVTVLVGGGKIEVLHGGERIAIHAELPGKRRRCIERAHLEGVIAGLPAQVQAVTDPNQVALPEAIEPEGELQRPLKDYEDAIGGEW